MLSPTFVWESRVGVVRNRNDARSSDYGLKTSEDIGIKGVNLNDWTSGLTEIRINGYTSPLVGFFAEPPLGAQRDNVRYRNNFSKTLTRHILRFGIEIRRERNDLLQTQTFNPRGLFQFEPGQTGDSGNTTRNFANAFAVIPPRYAEQRRARPALCLSSPARAHLQTSISRTSFSSPRSSPWTSASAWSASAAAVPGFAGGFSNYNYLNNTLELSGVGAVPIQSPVEQQLWTAPRDGLSDQRTDRDPFRLRHQLLPAPHGADQLSPSSRTTGSPPPMHFHSQRRDHGNRIPRILVLSFLPRTALSPIHRRHQRLASTPANLLSPYVQSWNLSVQRALPWKLSLDMAYVGNRGVNNQSDFNMNASMIPGSGNNGRPLFVQFRRTADTTAPSAPTPGTTHFN